MELVEGESLGDYIKRGERFTEAECLEIGRQTLAALREAHKAGVVHRDLKPDNLMLDNQRQIKVADLGLARFAAGDSSVALTSTGMSMGTPLYMAPELGARNQSPVLGPAVAACVRTCTRAVRRRCYCARS
jgi:serine/threonine-protein kinase